MATRPHGAVLQQIHLLFQRGSVSGLSEWQLLDRYASRRDESAFEALVARHGPMVLGVCRRVLDDPHAVEDAFQATFLVLVRKAGSLGERDAIGHWLYGVACRVALRARCEAAQRRSREVPVARVEAVARGDEPGRDELAPVLDEELSRLPPKYRAPGRPLLPRGTHSRRSRPPAPLADRVGQGTPVAGAGAAARAARPPRAGAVGGLARRRAEPRGRRGGPRLAAPGHGPGGDPDHGRAGGRRWSFRRPSLRLTEGVLTTMFLTKLKVTAAILGACGCLAVGGWGLAQSSRATNAGAVRRASRGGGVEAALQSRAPSRRQPPTVQILREKPWSGRIAT